VSQTGATAQLVRCLDVSGFQPAIDWNRAKAEGYEGVWARAAHGNDKSAPGKAIGPDGTDTMYRAHIRGAMQVGLAVGMYAVAFPLPHLNPLDQAEWFYARSDTLGAQDGELAPMLDLEWPSRENPGQKKGQEWRRWGCSGGQIVAWALSCLTHMEHLWKRIPLMYTYPWFWRTVIEAEDVVPEHLEALRRFRPWFAGGPYYEHASRVWIPDETNVQRHLPVMRPWDASDPWVWQHDGNGGLGIGKVDTDANVMRRATFDLLRRGNAAV
jgi:hypothetical protein